ncbi:MAG: mechanosensitive ion channel family protein [Prevotellaceae bacterium]|jgi:miniconductance mechanosensitive channel|nr:mechanosensitive ion channel family protein [Prevotellaceae bacterium]
MENHSPLLHWHSLYHAWLAEVFSSAGAANVIYVLSVLLVCVGVSVLLYRLGKWIIFNGTDLLIKRRASHKALLALKYNKFFTYPAYYLPLLVCKCNFDALLSVLNAPLPFLSKIYSLIAVILLVLMLNAALNAVVYLNKRSKHSKPIRGMVQLIQIVIYFVAAVVCVAILVNKSPTALVAGLGAASAVTMLIFKDSITSLVAGVQLSFNHIVRIGDWVSLPKYEVDGEVYDITLTSVKIRNWDKSMSMVPTYNLIVNDSVKNWRYMQEFGARRITRTLAIDVNSVKFCTPEMLERYRKIAGVSEALKRIKMLDEVSTIAPDANLQNLTNIGILRAYALFYLENKKEIRQDLDLMVRQRGSMLSGIPLEVYCYTNTTDTKTYEGIQSDIFDHLIALAPHFDLQIFQSAMSEG